MELDRRQLNGSIPPVLGKLAALTRLRLHKNSLTGGIPAELGDLAALTYLSLNGNRLTGPIPAELGNLSLLRNLWLSENRLSGGIPASLADLDSLEELRLGGNLFDGCVPGGLIRVSLISLSSSDVSNLGIAYCSSYYPNSGTLHYNGELEATATMVWANPSGWDFGTDCLIPPLDCATYEHDLKVSEDFFAPLIVTTPEGGYYYSWCRTETDLPHKYNDCPTAGVDEPEGYVIFSFGSKRAHAVLPGHTYSGTWTFRGLGEASSTTAGLYGQEGYFRRFCPLSVWCIFSHRDKLLTPGEDDPTESFVRWSRPARYDLTYSIN